MDTTIRDTTEPVSNRRWKIATGIVGVIAAASIGLAIFAFARDDRGSPPSCSAMPAACAQTDAWGHWHQSGGWMHDRMGVTEHWPRGWPGRP